MKEISSQPIEKLLKGVHQVRDTVGGTLGPKGGNVFLDTIPPRITNDGKTIADSIELEDRHENLGAWLLKNAAAQTNDDAGDGTTTTVVLTAAIIEEALKRPEAKIQVAQSLKEALPDVIEAIKDAAKPVTDIKQVALISAEDDTLATKVAEIVEKVGADGMIRVEENNEPVIDAEVVEGYEAHVGWLSPAFINKPEKLTCEYDDAPVFVTQTKISKIADVQRLFEQLKANGHTKIVLVCEDIDAEILGMFVVNKRMGALNINVIKATGPLLEDIAAATGATPVSDQGGVTFDTFDLSLHAGQATVVSTEKKTIFISKAASAQEQADRLEALADMNPNKYEADRARERAAKLRKGIAILRVGSPSTVDMTYLKDKADDAVAATQAALEEGVVEGGGLCLYKIARAMKPKTVGQQILARALQAPALKIIENSGEDPLNHKFSYPEHVIDPAKVERVAVTNAVLNAANFITVHAAVLEKPKKENA